MTVELASSDDLYCCSLLVGGGGEKSLEHPSAPLAVSPHLHMSVNDLVNINGSFSKNLYADIVPRPDLAVSPEFSKW